MGKESGNADVAACVEDGTFEARLYAGSLVAEGVLLLEIGRADRGILPRATAGSHLDLHLPNGLLRQYSIINVDRSPTRYLIAVKLDRESRGGSDFIHRHLAVGTRLTAGLPRNHFPLDGTAAHSVLIAGGIGVTPIMAMAAELASGGRSFELHYSCRTREETDLLARFDVLDKARLHIDDEAGQSFMNIHAIVTAAPAGSHFYCCGPAPMLAAFEVATAGIAAGFLHTEYFAPKFEASTEGGFEVELARSGRILVVRPGQSILEVAREAGLTIPTSCEHGICGTCETRVISGEPDHRDSVLTPAEQASNKTMMICCSGSLTGKLVLDL